MKPATAEAPVRPALVPLRRGLDLTALGALFVLTLRENLRGRRLLLLSLLFLLPSVLAVVVRLAPFAPPPEKLEFALIYNLIPHVLATLTALLYAAGIIRDEVEGQTLTYLLLRPLPRWALYLTKLAATILVTSALTGVFTLLTFAVIYANTTEFWDSALLMRALKAVAVMALAQAAYCSLFALLGLVTRWALLGGLAYIVIFEGLLANFDFIGRRLTVMYYFRVLTLRWLDPPSAEGWTLDLTTAASASTCVWTLLGASAVVALLGAALMMGREFRMKTPEGS
jgi:ABC-2 type transport system permease protein